MLEFPPWKVIIVLTTVLFGLLFAVPNVAPTGSLPGFLPQNSLKLGLDLQGGSYFLIEVDKEDLERNKYRLMRGDIRTVLNPRNGARIVYERLEATDTDIRVTIKNESEVSEAKSRIRKEGQNYAGPGNAFSIRDTGNRSFEVSLSNDSVSFLLRDAVAKSIEVIRMRIDALGTSEISISPQGDDRLAVEAPGIDDPERLKALILKAAVLTLNLVDEEADHFAAASGARVPRNKLYIASRDQRETGYPGLIVETRPIITGDQISNAMPEYHPESGIPIVSFRLNPKGGVAFGQATTKNVDKRFAIVLDNEIISAPNINEPITGGAGMISGGFETITEANDLAIMLRSGALPARLLFVDQRDVGPEMGADSVRAGAQASVLGLILIAIFMIFSYGRMGIFAVLSLSANIAMLIGALSALGATLTLPGIAGIILTIGMAVDANVLVYERIREEARNGRSPFSAVENGYARALSTILDANITTLIAALVLFQFGSGPIKGFSVTLGLGILTSVFTAFVLTRAFTVLWLRTTRPKMLPV